ncbi:hypothetical protein PENSTE_c006G09725 [Penicillium steckii]|uniref:AA1-like domain-containing protein n=1 Tax=Penicillium steckii TaxID=303698 RepID=A0A1V6TFW7_9EURO|nr:hypothetical protein PENSTE_c006G09725 [Penicillium steckii]
MQFSIIALLAFVYLSSAENDVPQYKFEVNLPALFGSHTSGFTFEGNQCQTLERSLWVNWMSIKPGDDYYRCTFYDRPDCSGKETAHFINKPSSGTPGKEVHVDKGQPRGNSVRCKALEE